ncbi:MAG TPA: hypothetical protein VHC70_02840, partial [Phycisphaerales bacterium]|nr:hypothetical protein [Phycisphaerales bacterium]
WYGSQRRYVFLANGKFVGEVGNWWDVVPQPTNPRSLAGRGANSGIRDSAVPVLRAVPGAFLGSGVSAGTVMEWVLPLWQPTVLAGAAVLALLWPELILLLAFRSRRRRRLGRCVKCGYDRAGLAAGAACPECGEHMAKLPKGQIAKWE